MTTPKELALALALTSTIADAAKEHKDYLRDRLAHSFDELGATATRAELDGEPVAKVTLVEPVAKASVRDDAAFVAYVAENFPTEIVQTVRTSFKDAFLKSLVDVNGSAVDPNTGEVVEGVTFTKSAGYVSTRFEKEGRARILDALRNGTLAIDLTETPALEAGDN